MNLKSNHKFTLKIGDIIILVMGLCISLILLLCIRQQETGDRVFVTVNGTVTQYYLGEDQVIPITGDNDNYNELVIQNGEIYMKEANCRDQICVRHKAISKNGEIIICLPHAVYVEVISHEDKDIDN